MLSLYLNPGRHAMEPKLNYNVLAPVPMEIALHPGRQMLSRKAPSGEVKGERLCPHGAILGGEKSPFPCGRAWGGGRRQTCADLREPMWGFPGPILLHKHISKDF